MDKSDGQIQLLGTRGSASAYAIRDFLHRCDLPFQWVELTSDEQAQKLAGVSGLRDGRLPVCLFPDGTRMECPTLRQITERLGWFRNPSRSEYDVSIYGGGPAGLSAAVYRTSANHTLNTVQKITRSLARLRRSCYTNSEDDSIRFTVSASCVSNRVS